MQGLGIALRPTKKIISLNIYQSIHKIPLTIFIDILSTQNYELLIINGNATKEELKPIWEQLYNDYAVAIGGKEFEDKLVSVKDTVIFQSRIQRARNILEVIRIKPSEELFKLLYDFDYPLPELKYSHESLDRVLKIFIAHYKRDLIELQQMATTIENQGGAVEMDYSYFTNIIVDMSTAFKMSININEISVGQYCIFVQKYKAHCDAIIKQQKTIT